MQELSLGQIKGFLGSVDIETKRTLQVFESFLKNERKNADYDKEKRLEILFYLLVTKIRMASMETPETRKYFSEFLQEMKQNTLYVTYEEHMGSLGNALSLKGITGAKKNINYRLKILSSKIKVNQIRAFLQVCEYYIHFLERIYKDLSMSDRVMELYVVRMDIQRSVHFFNRRFALYTGFSVFKGISLYGTSFSRLAITCFSSILLFGSIYWFADYFAPPNLRMISDLHSYSSYLFNSLTTITGLGIDASPATGLQRLAMGINAIYGMVVFGMLFNVISTKLSMNS
ncbi:MAG: hypothetical protein PHH70_03720 [Candidatus Gracilibacteria bacterium]|nr:hypothetical protein [Candidatus Gracilibacteria bacterium]